MQMLAYCFSLPDVVRLGGPVSRWWSSVKMIPCLMSLAVHAISNNMPEPQLNVNDAR